MSKYILLDRDGVINYDSDQYIKTPDEWKAIDSSMLAIRDLYRAGYKIVVITNQSGIGRGYYSEETLSRIHDKMCKTIEEHGGHIEHIYYCPHSPEDHCLCRKPKPGMIMQAIAELKIEPSNTYLVGDALRDLEAAAQAKIAPILVTTGKGARTAAQDKDKLPAGTKVFDNLKSFTDQILK